MQTTQGFYEGIHRGTVCVGNTVGKYTKNERRIHILTSVGI